MFMVKKKKKRENEMKSSHNPNYLGTSSFSSFFFKKKDFKK